MKKVLVPLVNRTNYSKLRPLILELQEREDVQISVILSSGIIIDRYGAAYKDIEKDGVKIEGKVECLLSNDTLESMSVSMGVSLMMHSSKLKEISPDVILMVGDRFDTLPIAIAAQTMNIPILHIQGGERSGSIDDKIRDIISICADVHYVSTEGAKKTVERITLSDNVYNFGCPAVDHLVSMDVGDGFDEKDLSKHYKDGFGISLGEKYILSIFHPNTKDEQNLNMDNVFEAMHSFDVKKVLLWPNVDAFSQKIIEKINRHRGECILVKHMPLSDFVRLMAHASCMIGNSSAGIREAASFGTPVVNIGNRQNNRERNRNTIDCDSEVSEVKDAITRSLEIGRYEVDNVYHKDDCIKNISDNVVSYLEKL